MGCKIPNLAPDGPKPPASPAPAPLRSAMMGFRPAVLDSMNRSYEVEKRHAEFVRLEDLASRVSLPGFTVRVEEVGEQACFRVGWMISGEEGPKILWSRPYIPKSIENPMAMAYAIKGQASKLFDRWLNERLHIDGVAVFSVDGGPVD